MTAPYQKERIADGHWRIHRGSQVFGEVKRHGPNCWVATPKGTDPQSDIGNRTTTSLGKGAEWLAQRFANTPPPRPSGKYLAPPFNGAKD